MKKLYVLLASMLASTLGFAQMTTLEGTADFGDVNKKIYLYTIVEGEAVEYAHTNIAADKSFAFRFTPGKEGFYMIGGADFQHYQVPVYIKPGVNVQVDLQFSRKAATTVYGKKNSAENQTLGTWLALSNTVRNKAVYFRGGPESGSIYSDFNPELEKLVAEKENFKKSIRTKNAQFNNLMRQYVDASTEFYALFFWRTPRREWPKEGTPKPAFYQDMIVNDRFPDNTILSLPDGAIFLNMYVDQATGQNTNTDSSISVLSTNEQKGIYLAGPLSRIKSHNEYVGFAKKYGEYFCTPKLKLALENKGAELYKSREGGPASDFTYPDLNGKNVSLSDFKGKVVLVDVWATWCGPCKQQLPYLKTLEEELAGKDIVFLAVSVDEMKNYEAWKKMIAEKELKGIHLFANGWSKITKDYKINGIPRFMLFDKNGNIVTTQAPRPSDPALKEMILKELKK